MRVAVAVASALVLISIGIRPSQAAQRVALVVGNSDYRYVPALRNPKNDAEDIARSLRELEFETILATDLDHAGMNAALNRFSRVIAGAEIALFYYSGHGMQFLDKNFLLPVDARLTSADDINRFQLIPLNDIFEALGAAKRGIVVLDACRNNPVEEELKRRLASVSGTTRDAYMSRGLGRVPVINGLIVAYATQANEVAADGRDRNSPFTESFLKHVGAPNVDVRQMLIQVQDEVAQLTQGRQRPELRLSAIEGFKLKAGISPNQVALPSQDAPPVAAQPSRAPAFDPRAMELSHWESVRNSTSIDTIRTYLDRYPNGEFADVAKAKIRELQRPPQPAPAQVLPPQPPAVVASRSSSTGLIPRTGQQPSRGVDCRRPDDPAERLICADAELAEADGRMGGIFWAKADDGRRSRGAFISDQKDWVARRNAQCGVPNHGNQGAAELAAAKPCMLRMTRERARDLAVR